MRLTDEEQRMYHGERGPTVAQAMDYLVRFGEACDSDSMVDISYAHVNPGRVGGPSDIHEVPELAAAGAKVVIPTTVLVVRFGGMVSVNAIYMKWVTTLMHG